MALTPKQKRFVDEYLIDLNATQAAIRAKYSKKTAQEQGARLLSNVMVQAAVQRRMKDRESRTEITQDMVLKELARIGFSDIRKIVKWGETEIRVADGEDGEMMPFHGLALFCSDQVDDETAAAISEVSEGREGLKVKLHDKKGALVEIAKHLGMFTAKGHGELDLEIKRVELEKRRAELENIRNGGGSPDTADLLRDLIAGLPS